MTICTSYGTGGKTDKKTQPPTFGTDEWPGPELLLTPPHGS
jgi:hypothetical protein